MKKKLQLKKETIAILNNDSMTKVVGGALCQNDADCQQDHVCQGTVCQAATTTTILISLVVLSETVTINQQTQATTSCLTCKPGHQDSCGLCTTNFRC